MFYKIQCTVNIFIKSLFFQAGDKPKPRATSLLFEDEPEAEAGNLFGTTSGSTSTTKPSDRSVDQFTEFIVIVVIVVYLHLREI